MASERKNEISLYNVFLCFLVIFIHINASCIVGFPQNTFKFSVAMELGRLSAFAVQGFILLSGVKLFLNQKYEIGYFKFLGLRFKGIIIPYAISYIFYYVFYYVIYDYPISAPFILKHFVLGSLVCHFYFIPLLFQFDLLLPLWKVIINKFSPIFVIPVSILMGELFGTYFPTILSGINPNVSFVYNDRIFTTYIAYWVIGCYIGKYYDSFKELISKNFKFIVSIFTIVTATYLYYNYLSYNGLLYVPFLSLLTNTYILIACIFCYSLFIKISKFIPQKKTLLNLIDYSSYKIYLYHMIVLMFCDAALTYFGIISIGLSTLIRVIVVYSVSITLCIFINKIQLRLRLSK